MIQFRRKKYQAQQKKILANPNQVDISQAASGWIMRREQLPEYRFAIELMSQAEKEAVFWHEWDSLDSFAQRDLAKATFSENWYQLIAGYPELNSIQKVQVLEAMAYIHNKHVVDFVIGEMKREDDGLRLAASAALKTQDPLLPIEPMMGVWSKLEVFLVCRV